jgi:hypothetical protein
VKLHTVFVTHNRLELTKRTIGSYRETVTLPHTVYVVDNASTDGTQEWLLGETFDGLSLLDENHYPGFATNLGFSHAGNASHLHRSDNDVEYRKGWCKEVRARFKDPSLWQLGLRTLEEEGPHGNVGGNCVFARAAWEAGIRYPEKPWTQVPFEDGAVSGEVVRMGHVWERAQRPCIEHIGIASRDDPYYQQTFIDRNITFEQYGIGG